MFQTLNLTDTGAKVWITADYHFGHARMIEVTERPWKNIDRHDSALIRNTCEVVDDNDILIINGDLTMVGPDRTNFVRSIVERLPGRKILVFGNHDRIKPLKYVDMGFMIAATSLIIPHKYGPVFIAHDPAWAQTWPADKPMLCGHVHELFRSLRNVVNVGIDAHGYYPIQLDIAIAEAVASIKAANGRDIDWKKVSKDRHKEADLAREKE